MPRARQLSEGTLQDDVADALREAELEPSALCVEITESALVENLDVALPALQRLKATGVAIALDDFGVGFSSLSRIRELPAIDVIKIDRSFTAGFPEDRRDAAVVSAVISLAARLGVSVIAEGIETERQHRRALRARLPHRAGFPVRAAAGSGQPGGPAPRPGPATTLRRQGPHRR